MREKQPQQDSLLELSGSAIQLLDPGHLIGTTIANRFKVEAHLGDFNGREIYAGRQVALERPVSIKLVKNATDQDLCQRFLREGRLLAKLDHAGIVSVIDVGEHDGRPYIVTEAPRGDTLEAILEVRGRIDWRAAHDLLIAIADAVGSAHAAGMVHRDLHPRNIVVGTDGMPRIMDFVFAYETAPYDDDTSTQMLTARGAIVGAIEWVAPEQLMGFPVDTRADLYSLGVLAYRMISGRVPHQASRAAEILSLIGEGARPLMTQAELPDHARSFAALVDRLLAHDANERGFKNASQLAKSLRELRAVPTRNDDERTEPAIAPVTPLRERAIELSRSVSQTAAAKAKLLIARAKALPQHVRVGIGVGAAVLSICTVVAFASGEPEPEMVAQPIAVAPVAAAIDPSQIALREDARQAAQRNDIPRALGDYRSLAHEAFEDEDYRTVVTYLGRPNSNTGVAEEIIVSTAPTSVPALREAFESDRSGRYLKRRAGEVLQKLGEDVDLVPLWIGTLQSDECGARKLAVQKLVESGDPRAIIPLRDLSHTFRCGGEEARIGLRRLTSSG